MMLLGAVGTEDAGVVARAKLNSYHHLPIWEEHSKSSSHSHTATRKQYQMSTTPPKKGKKRAPPSTPKGQLLAKASRPSSPSESQRSGTPRAAASTLTQSDLPNTPTVGSTSGRPSQAA